MLDINPDLALKNANIVSHALPDRSVAQLVTKKMQTWQVAHLADLSHNCLSDEPGPANPAGETKVKEGQWVAVADGYRQANHHLQRYDSFVGGKSVAKIKWVIMTCMTGLMMVISLDSSPNVKCQSELLTIWIDWAFANLNSPCRSVARRRTTRFRIHKNKSYCVEMFVMALKWYNDKRNVTITICENSKI